ncbi:MAG TPA: hypothetical protein VNW97_08180 [Candidatus Saccharimonadales bacterium]|jgi:hypothetical protein|nr:hypothetical protein [Candidatus Saccharimonadales bacterium]
MLCIVFTKDIVSPLTDGNSAIAARVRFIEHAGTRVLAIDYRHCDVALLKQVVMEGHRVISRELPNSVLTLNDVAGTQFDQESVKVLKSMVAANAPYVKRAAIIGISGLQLLIYDAVQTFSQRRIPRFSSQQDALDWLVKEEEE